MAKRERRPASRLNQMMKQVQKMQADMAAAQDALADRRSRAAPAAGWSRSSSPAPATCSRCSIAPDVVDPDDVEMLEDLVLAAVSDGLRRAQELQSREHGGVTGGLDLGGLGGLLG